MPGRKKSEHQLIDPDTWCSFTGPGLVKDETALFAAAYPSLNISPAGPDRPTIPAMEDKFRITPSPECFMSGRALWTTSHLAFRVVSISRSHCSLLTSWS